MASETDMESTTLVKDREVDDVEETVTETAEPAVVSARKSAPLRARTPGRGGRIAVGVLLAALVAATGFFGYHYFSSPADAAADRAAIASTADDYATKLASFDYRDLNKNREQITAMSTSAFAAKYDEMVKALTEIVANGQGVATAKVSHAAVESIDGDTATVIAFVDQKATNVVAPNGKDQPYRMVLTLKRDGDRWLVDDVQTV